MKKEEKRSDGRGRNTHTHTQKKQGDCGDAGACHKWTPLKNSKTLKKLILSFLAMLSSEQIRFPFQHQ